MTLKQLIKLAKKGRTWHIIGPTIRCSEGFCPIIAAYRSIHPKSKLINDEYDKAAKSMKLSQDLAISIAVAADSSIVQTTIRRELLKGLGLV